MEPTEASLRLKLVLGKYRVVDRWQNLAKLELDKQFSMIIIVPNFADVREGDLLTLYTEVLYDKTVTTPVQ